MKFQISNFKFIIFLAVIGFLLTGSYFYYRRTHSKYMPLPPRPEVALTIIPGWNLRQVAEYLVNKGFASTTKDVYELTGEPAKKASASLEGFLAPETIRVFADAKLVEIIKKFTDQADKDYSFINTSTLPADVAKLEIVTMASIIEKETRHGEDRAIVSDILWRRLKKGWALQLDSTVHYAVDKTGTVFTTGKEREVDSLWNTYKYPGLPPGPIGNPSLESIDAALNPTKNNYWYFLSGSDGQMHYAKTLEEQNVNRVKYLQ